MSDPHEQAIRERAYAIWEQEGRPEDRNLPHWLQAEAEIGNEQILGITDDGKPVKRSDEPPAYPAKSPSPTAQLMEEVCGWDTIPGKRLTSVQMIEKHVRIAKELGRPIATAEEARKILKIGVTYNSTEETLVNLGLPPNREGGQKGFIGYTTSGGKTQPTQVGGSDGHPLAGHH